MELAVVAAPTLEIVCYTCWYKNQLVEISQVLSGMMAGLGSY